MSKYQINDIVRFTAPDGSVKEGYIWRIDVYPLAICYDIFIRDKNVIYKHLAEKWVQEKTGVNTEEDFIHLPTLIDDYRE